MSSPRRVVPPPWWIAVAVGAMVVAGAALEAAFFLSHPEQLAPHRFVSFLYLLPSTVVLAVVAVAVVGRRPRHPVGWLFTYLALASGSNVLANGYTAWELPVSVWLAWLQQVLGAPAFGGLALALLLFPSGRLPSRRWRWLLRVELVQVVGTVGLAGVAQRTAPVYPNELPTPENPLAIGGQELAGAFNLAAGLGILTLLASAASLVFRWRHSAGDERLQVKWIGAAGLVFAAISAIPPVTLVLGVDLESGAPVEFLVGDAIWNLALTLVPAAMGVAIVRHRLYDVDRLISRTIAYSVLAFALGAAYVGAVVAASAAVTSDAGSTVAAVAIAALVATVFHPLRLRLQAAADRWVYGARAAPYETMSGLAHQLGEAIRPDDVLARIAETVAQAVGADVAEVSISLPDGGAVQARSGEPTGGAFGLVVPIVDGDGTIGEIAVSGGADRRGDRELLDRIAALSTPALRNVRLLAELDVLLQLILDQNHRIATSRSRLITAASQERQHLRRLVARRIDPHLSALRNALPELREALRQGPEHASERCRELVDVATQVVEEIRVLSRGVLPPVLTDHGLIAALRATLRRLDVDAVLDAPPSLDDLRFDTPVEVTAYLCCRAAVDSAVTSGATRVHLTLEADAAALSFTVTHDAAAAHPSAVSGELLTERDLIETMLGDLDIEHDGDLTVITGHVPLSAAQPTSLRKVSTA